VGFLGMLGKWTLILFTILTYTNRIKGINWLSVLENKAV
jgi:hypothetical protein